MDMRHLKSKVLGEVLTLDELTLCGSSKIYGFNRAKYTIRWFLTGRNQKTLIFHRYLPLASLTKRRQ